MNNQNCYCHKCGGLFLSPPAENTKCPICAESVETPKASSQCHICGIDTPHVHNAVEQGQYTKICRLSIEIAELKQKVLAQQARNRDLFDLLAPVEEYLPNNYLLVAVRDDLSALAAHDAERDAKMLCAEVEMRLAALQVKVDAAITIDVEPDAWASKINFISPEYKQVPLKKSLNPMNDTHEKLYLERTVIGLMKAAKYDGYTEREEELSRMKETK